MMVCTRHYVCYASQYVCRAISEPNYNNTDNSNQSYFCSFIDNHSFTYVM